MALDWLTTPPIALIILSALCVGIYWMAGRSAPREPDAGAKRQSYTGGEELAPAGARMSYQRFFRLALLFVVAHMAVLVVAILPRSFDARILATAYLIGLGVCLDVLIIRRET